MLAGYTGYVLTYRLRAPWDLDVQLHDWRKENGRIERA